MKRELSRRKAIGLLSGAALALRLLPRAVFAQGLRGALDPGLDATHEGLTPGSPDDQSEAFARALAKADAEGRPLFLPPGRYEVGDVALPNNTPDRRHSRDSRALDFAAAPRCFARATPTSCGWRD